MQVLAYVLTIILTPTIVAFGVYLPLTPLMLGVGGGHPRIFGIVQGVLAGLVAATICFVIFKITGVDFSSTPLWVIVGIFAVNDLRRLSRATGEAGSMFEVGNLVGFPIGVYLWAQLFI